MTGTANLETSEAVDEQCRRGTAQRNVLERDEFEKQLLAAREAEQKRFSQDFHDGLGQHLLALEFRIDSLRRNLDAIQCPHASAAAEIFELVKDASRQAHDLVRGADPVPLDGDGLMIALRSLMETLCRSAHVHCCFECHEPVQIEDHAVAVHLYRIAQEAITNALKYSGASKICVRLDNEENAVVLTVSDNGRGFVLESASRSGRGLNIMRERARLIGATLDMISSPGAGSTIRCSTYETPNI